MSTNCLFKVHFNLKVPSFKNVEEIKICKEEAIVNYKMNRGVTLIGKAYVLDMDMKKPLSLEEKVIKKTEKEKLGKETFLLKFFKKKKL